MALKQQSLTKNLPCACLEQPVLIKARNWYTKPQLPLTSFTRLNQNKNVKELPSIKCGLDRNYSITLFDSYFFFF